MKKKWIKIGVLILVLALFLAFGVSRLIVNNRGTEDETVGLGEPTLP